VPLICDSLTETMRLIRKQGQMMTKSGFSAACERECPIVACVNSTDFANVLT
jgi:hypothetical protein